MDPYAKWDPDIRALVNEFAQLVVDNGHPLPGRGTKAADAWFAEMERLVRLGPPGDTAGAPAPSVEEVRAVMHYALTDLRDEPGGFPGWGAVIRSVSKFRAQFSRLRLEARRNGQPKAGAAYTQMAADLRRQGR